MTKLCNESPQLFSQDTVLNYFSLQRLMCRGVILRTAGRVMETTINAIIRWCKKNRARGTIPNLCMRQTYMQTRDLVHERIKYALAF